MAVLSYAVAATADALLLDEFGGDVPTEWTGLDTVTKDQWLVKATLWMDRRYHDVWKGRRATSGQERDWPRTSVYDRDMFLVSSSETPTAVRLATSFVALLMAQGVLSVIDSAIPGSIKSRTEKLDAFGETTVYATPIPAEEKLKHYPRIDAILSDLITIKSSNRPGKSVVKNVIR